MAADGQPEDWTRKGLEWIGIAACVVLLAGLGIYSFLSSMVSPLHREPAQIPSVARSAPSPQWTSAVEQARQLARKELVEANLPGLSVAVGAGGELVWAEGFGWADLEKKIPVAPHLRFRIGHASNALTSAGVGLLVEQKRLNLDDEIQKYVPAYPKKQWPVTVRQLMGHTAGVRHYRSEADYMPTAHCERASEGLAPFAGDPLLFEPETQYQYSTFGWVLVSAAVEAAAGEPFFGFMRARVFTPLGMHDTTVDSASEPDRVTPYYPRLSGDPQYGADVATPVDYSCFAGAGAFLSTPSDLVRFALALNRGTLLKRETVRKLQAPQVLTSHQETDYGLGWTVETHTLAGHPTTMASHASRTLLGSSVSFMVFPERGLVVAVTSNISRAATRSLALAIAEAFADQSNGPAR